MYEYPQVGFVEAFKLFWINYVNFKGRSRRSEYWWVVLWHTIISLSATLISIMFIFIPLVGPFIAIILWILIGLYGLATVIPNLALLVRRFHDRNMTMFLPVFSFVLSFIYNIVYFIGIWQSGELMSTDQFNETAPVFNDASSGWLIASGILGIVILIIQIIIFIITLLDSKEMANKYGPSPKYTSHSVQGNNQQGQSTMSQDVPTEDDTPVQDDSHLTDLDALETQERKPQDDPYKY
ncbi:DUF805 domain-containing protein [Staphylococcus americanisciuri]|uniref:DUF805 domain-containing protein n=1 Tax=Staphylococcus americanisciuri TaxID=2973940 RepID=A0ABT2F0W0_9STAP|nr:DUF805 domain-containing protein [Staphylococcus americanisciuri]MCS4486078.1 DUF805 domain-containing protein [Staphylococcus americanisciuri]